MKAGMNAGPRRHGKALFLSMAMLAATGAQSADGVGRNTLLIGQSITLQGGKNAYGEAVQAGITTYLKLANQQGGVHGRQLVLKTLDDDNSSSQAEKNARTLVEQDKVFILFGSIEGGPSTAVMKAAVELKTPSSARWRDRRRCAARTSRWCFRCAASTGRSSGHCSRTHAASA